MQNMLRKIKIQLLIKLRLHCKLKINIPAVNSKVGGQAVLGRQDASPTPWLTERHGYDPTWGA